MDISEIFTSYELPDDAIDVRCHALQPEHVEAFKGYLANVLPECYITHQHLKCRVEETGLDVSSILCNKLPDKGSVMSGDFGEILTLFFLNSECKSQTVPIKKWRYKQDRTKAAPHSDVVILYRKHNKKKVSKEDFVVCAEAKQKATNSAFNPIGSAIDGYQKDRNGRLARTLVWLKEKAIDIEAKDFIDYIKRFTDLTKVEYSRYFKATAIIDLNLLDDELTREIDLPEQNEHFEVIVLGIPDLKQFYETVFDRCVTECSL
jgi:hypothetical protein